MSTSAAEFRKAFSRLGIGPQPVIAHASLSAFGRVEGGAAAVAQALVDFFPEVLMPTFTYKTMVTPEVGPAENALDYGRESDRNRLAEFFSPGMPADRMMGAVPEALRSRTEAQRSAHPILSFAGVNAAPALQAQTLADPLAPLRALMQAGGWVLLLGVDQTVNTSIHLGERLAGRKTFLRWALTPDGVVECPGFPGCSDGFNQLSDDLLPITRVSRAGQGQIQALPLLELVDAVIRRLRRDPLSLLCDRTYCARCEAVRGAFMRPTPYTL